MTKNSNFINALKALALVFVFLFVTSVPALLFGNTNASAAESFTDDVSCSNQHAHVNFGTASEGYITIDVTMDITKKARAVLSSDNKESTFELPATHASVLPLTSGSGKYDVTVYNQDDNDEYQEVLSTSFQADLTDETVPYLQANAYVYYEYGDDVQFIAEELSAEADSVEAALGQFENYVTTELTFEPVITSDVPMIDQALKTKKASNIDAVAVFTAMCRTQNIPCRMHIGEFNNNTPRAWAEAFVDGQWVRYDLALTSSLDNAHEAAQNDNHYVTNTIM